MPRRHSLRLAGGVPEQHSCYAVAGQRAIRSRRGKMGKNVCTGDHSGHICVLASEGKFEEIKGLTKNPEHICFNCGRVADSNENLCNPMPLK